jgi:Uroporphyrinogen-III decarboxylase
MNSRERFIATLRFEKTDRPFRWESPAIWPSAVKNWYREGLPENITYSEIFDYFNMDKLEWIPFEGGWCGDPFYPMFEKKVVNDDGEHLVIADSDGITKKIKKDDPDTSMPQFLKFPVENREDYESKILWRYDYTSKRRFPENWRELTQRYSERDYPLGMFVIGPFGHLRNLMGDEGLMYMLYDDPGLIHNIMTHWRDFYIGFINLVCMEVIPDFIMIWEDMCYKSGPLISPETFKEFMAPYLKDVITTAKAKGVHGIIVDNDGDCSKMLPIYLDCGANAFYPFEVQAGMDIVDIRSKYGNLFTIIGGLDKKTLNINEEAVKAEVDLKVPFMLSKGGYIPMLDHSVPVNVSMRMFKFFLDYVRNIK